MRRYVYFIAAALIAGGSFAAPSYAGPDTSARSGKADDPDKVVCRRMPIPGRLDASRTCKTRRQWRAEADAATESGERMQEKGLIKSCATCM
jgi:hypothetical protein